MAPEERARAGLFLAFQYPVEIPGVGNTYFLRTALNAIRKHRGLEPVDAMDFLALVKAKMQSVDMDPKFLNRSVNEGFSGGEKKRNEILQMAVLEPTLAILDETDSGLDIDALRIVADGVNALRNEAARGGRHHPLPAPAQLPGARLRARAGRRAHRRVGRQAARHRARGEGLRGLRGAPRRRERDTHVRRSTLITRTSAASTATRPARVRALRERGLTRFTELGFPDHARWRTGSTPTWRRSPSGPFHLPDERVPRGAEALAERARLGTGDRAGVRQRPLRRRAVDRRPRCRPARWSPASTRRCAATPS